MKAFILLKEEIASVAAALVVEELGASFGRHIDTLTGSTWSAATPLYEGGAELSPREAEKCLARLYRFFGQSDHTPRNPQGELLGDWTDEIAALVASKLTEFCFASADDDANEIAHAADTIYADAASVANLLYGRRRILSLVAPHSLIGFILSALTPNLLLTPAIDIRTMTPEQLKDFLAFGDAMVATPSLWRYVIAQGVVAPDNTMAISFGEPMTAALSAGVRKAGFGAQREIYGSTEHGLIGWRDTPGDPFALFDQWKRNGRELRRATPAGSLIDVTPMDVLLWDGERRFRLGGRRDGAIQIGGVNVFPSRIAQKIAEHSDIADCAIAMSREDGGVDRLIATIRLKTEGPPSETLARSIDTWCRQKLRPYERPRVYNFADAIA